MDTTNKLTKNSIVLSFILLIVILFTVWFFTQNKKTTNISRGGVEIVEKTFDQELFTGSYNQVLGKTNLAKVSNDYIAGVISDFKADADKSIPGLRAEFGEDNPTTKYTLDIEAEYAKGLSTESIIISTYKYTGGANGISEYKVFTVDINDQILSIDQIIKTEAQDDFVTAVKNKILDWKVEGESIVFKEDVEKLNLESFSNFSLDNESLFIYFDEYKIAPGYVGPIAFKMSLIDAEPYLAI